MSLFRRSKKDEPAAEVVEDEETIARREAQEAEDAAEAAAVERAYAADRRRRKQGPFDFSEVDSVEDKISLGSLFISPREGMELRMEVAEDDQSVRSVAAVLGSSEVQLQIFAGPRTEGVWDGIREDLTEEITRQGGTAEELQGTFGDELLARLPVRLPDGRTGHQATRFIGVDGPRWFLRGVFAGDAVTNPEAAAELEEIVKNCVVRRGPEPLPPRDLLLLSLPTGASRRDEEGTEEQELPLRAPERGPEIAEIR